MAQIKIKQGHYGLHTATGVKAMGPESGIFSVSDEEANRLVALGVAEVIGSTLVATGAEDNSNSTPDAEETNIPHYDENMTANELRAIAKSAGITFKVGTTKKEMLAALDEAFKADNADEIPDLSAENPVV